MNYSPEIKATENGLLRNPHIPKDNLDEPSDPKKIQHELECFGMSNNVVEQLMKGLNVLHRPIGHDEPVISVVENTKGHIVEYRMYISDIIVDGEKVQRVFFAIRDDNSDGWVLI